MLMRNSGIRNENEGHAIVLYPESGGRRRFAASAVVENAGRNSERVRALRRGRVEDAPDSHPFGVALMEVPDDRLPPELLSVKREQLRTENLLSKARETKRAYRRLYS